MNIDWVIPCRYVEVHDNLATIIGGGIDTYWFPELPAQVQVTLAVRLNAMADELDAEQQHRAVNRVRDPRGQMLSEVAGDFSIAGEAARPEWLVGITLATAVVFEATEEGTYTIEHEVDGAAAALPIHVVRGAPSGAE